MLLDNTMQTLGKWSEKFLQLNQPLPSVQHKEHFKAGKKMGRISFIDSLRASAVLLMIFAHVLDAVLAPEYKKDDLYRFFNFINGFVAPAFLFAAGASFTIVITKRRDDILNFRPSAWKQLMKVFQLFVLGYLLHLPFKTFHQMQTIMTMEQYQNFLRIDVLHVIAIGLLVSQIIFVIVRDEKRLFMITTILALASIAFTPFARYYDFTRIFPIEIATYFNRNLRSIFPLFPWISYIFFGSMIMSVILKYSEQGNLDYILKRIFCMGVVLIILASIPELLGINPNDKYNFWHTSPNIICIKLGTVLIYMVFMWFLQTRYSYKMKVLKIFGQESLFVYVFHLVIVYGSALSVGLSLSVGRTFNRLEMFAMYIGVVILSFLMTLLWHKIKKFSLLYARIILFSTTIYFFYYFTTKLF